jgi:hypothetical protein
MYLELQLVTECGAARCVSTTHYLLFSSLASFQRCEAMHMTQSSLRYCTLFFLELLLLHRPGVDLPSAPAGAGRAEVHVP